MITNLSKHLEFGANAPVIMCNCVLMLWEYAKMSQKCSQFITEW